MDILESQRQTGLKVAYYRRLAKLTQWDLSNQLGMTVTYVSLIERGHNRASTDTLLRIAKILNCSIEDLGFKKGE